MEYKLYKNKIEIIGKEDFCPKHILECGQIFSYIQTDYGYIVYSAKEMAEIIETKSGYIINTTNPNYFESKYFDRVPKR